jgi:hypothetical protein
MKKLITGVLFFISFSFAFASDEAYKNAMKENLDAMKNAKSAQEFQEVANTFERISKIASKEWLPLYYAGLAYINMSHMEQDKALKEPALDKARPFIDQAVALAPKECEVIVLDGYWTMMKMSYDPATRGQTMAPAASQLFSTALSIEPENPRAIAMKAEMEYGSAKFFGSSTETACNMFKKSLPFFDKAPVNELAPTWGKERAQYMADNCK